VFAITLKGGTTSLVLSHNHPSGNLKPSGADIAITKRMKDAGMLLDIDIVDHLILSSEGYYSFAEEDLI